MEKKFFKDDSIRIKFSRAGGPGGQNVNKRSTRVQVWLPVETILVSEKEKNILRDKLSHRITSADEIEISSEEGRSQESNRKKVISNLNEIIRTALIVPPKRIPTKISKTAEARFQKEKKENTEKKRLRKILHHTILEEE